MAKILGIRVDDVDSEKALELASGFLRDGKQHTIFTPNPEMLVAAHRSNAFRDVLNAGSLNLCDGRGAQLAGRLTHRVCGVDFMQKLCKFAATQGYSVYLLGSGSEEVIQKTKAELTEANPELRIVGANAGPWIDENGAGESATVVQDVNEVKPDILFVAFGHQKQEMWINKHLQELPSVKIAMGVGGSFDFISGKAKRAPAAMRRIGLEWMWRLMQQPGRVARIFRATVVFPLLVMKSKF